MSQNTFGPELRRFRTSRRISQMDLALSAGVSARHVSFLESGRARPSRGMVLTLADTMELPAAATNTLLISAEFSPVYTETTLEDDAAAPLARAVDWMLSKHMPYPALAVDRDWVLVGMNPSASAMLAGLNIGVGDNLIETVLRDGLGPEVFENWTEVVVGTYRRLRTESAHQGGNPRLDALARQLELPDNHLTQAGKPFVPVRVRFGDLIASFVTTIAQFGTTDDIALSAMRVELFFPADDATRHLLENMS